MVMKSLYVATQDCLALGRREVVVWCRYTFLKGRHDVGVLLYFTLSFITPSFTLLLNGDFGTGLPCVGYRLHVDRR